MTKKEELTQKKGHARKVLLEWLKPGDTVKTVVRHVAKSGMSRSITLIAPNCENIDYYAATVIGSKVDGNNGGIRIGGCGMDMGFALVYELGRALWPDGDGKYTRERNGNKEPEKDGGYLLNHRWL